MKYLFLALVVTGCASAYEEKLYDGCMTQCEVDCAIGVSEFLEESRSCDEPVDLR